MKYNIIGDIHARTCWRHLVQEDCVNIFVGDYFDPYEYVPIEEQIVNYRAIITFIEQHPETVLLYGNHELHYLISTERYSSYDTLNAPRLSRVLNESRPFFHGIAYPIGEKALVTHAGVTKEWYEKYIGTYQSEPLVEVAQHINDLWNTNMSAFTFDSNATEPNDRSGISPTHSPIWVRPDTLKQHDLFAGTNIKQIFGHTQTEAGVMSDCNLIYVDCLGTREKTYVIEA